MDRVPSIGLLTTYYHQRTIYVWNHKGGAEELMDWI
jgi:hypothetical protein